MRYNKIYIKGMLNLTGIYMRAQKYEDGVMRINAKIEIPMSLDDVGVYVMSAIINNKTDIDDVTSLNKRELLRLAKSEIYDNGVRDAFKHDLEKSPAANAIVKNYIKKMFPELQ
jgi:hypothetical protein